MHLLVYPSSRVYDMYLHVCAVPQGLMYMNDLDFHTDKGVQSDLTYPHTPVLREIVRQGTGQMKEQ